MNIAGSRWSALLLTALAVYAYPAAAQIRTTTKLETDPNLETTVLLATPTSVTVTPGGAPQTITVSASYVGELTGVRFLLNGVAAANMTAQWGAVAETERPLSVQAGAAAVAGTYTVQTQRGTLWQTLPSKVAVVLPTTTTTVKAPETTAPLKGRYRVVLTGGRVNHETYDNTLNLDGWKDEIYFTVDVQLLDKVSGTISPFVTLSDRTKTYGDLGTDGTIRVKAGTAWPSGGLKSGDQFPDEGPFNPKGAFVDRQIPLRLWEGDLIQGQNAVIITPMVWEHDGTAFADAITGWMNFAKEFTTKLADSKAIDQLVAGTGSGVAGMLLDIAQVVPTLVLGVTSNLGRDGDRQIGAGVEGDKVVFKPQPLLLNFVRIEQFLNSGVQVGNAPKGYYPIAFREPMTNKLEGDYTLYLQIQRLP